MVPSGSRRRGTFLLVTVLVVLQLACWRGTQRLHAIGRVKRSSLQDGVGLKKRDSFDDQYQHDLKIQNKSEKKKKKERNKHSTKSSTTTSSSSSSTNKSSSSSNGSSSSSSQDPGPTGVPCQPLPFSKSPRQICDHVRLYCPRTGHLDYLQFYYCTGIQDEGSSSETTWDQVYPTPAPRIPKAAWSSDVVTKTNESFSKDTEEAVEDPILITAKGGDGDDAIPKHLVMLRLMALGTIILWMLFLFSWVGVVASDFFCPNLSTIAARLGLSESTAGVTFLAFGNGSPDVFSTFGAMRTGSGSLAIGELIGAASFIVSVISGSMMLIAPFRVKAYPFLRDVGFFTVAVAMTMSFLLDGKLLFAECLALVGLYFAYAATVIIGSWIQERRRRRRVQLATARAEYDGSVHEDLPQDEFGNQSQHNEDVERQSLLTVPIDASPRPVSPSEYDPDVNPFETWTAQQARVGSTSTSRRTSPHNSPNPPHTDLPTTGSASSGRFLNASRFRPGAIARHSLLGAVEFRDVVRSLQQEALIDRSMEVFQSRDPERFYHHSQHHHPNQSDQAYANKPSQSRGHARVKSLVSDQPQTSVEGGDKWHRDRSLSLDPLFSEQPPSITRSVSTSASDSNHERQGRKEPALQLSAQGLAQPSTLDATAVAAAVGDPWKEHGPADGCQDDQMLPPPAIPLNRSGPRKVPQPTLRRDLPRIDTSREEDIDSNAVTTGSTHVASSANITPSITVSGAGDERSRSRLPLQDTVVPRRSRSLSSQGNKGESGSNLSQRSTFKRSTLSLLRVLFPSLRHFREKSWLGVAVGLVTAPAICILNLTLPVVDDEAERAAIGGEKMGTMLYTVGTSPEGRIRLHGGEADLQARRPHLGTAEHDDDNNDNDSIIDLRGANETSSRESNPWNSAESAEEVETEENRQKNLQIGDTLRRLPQAAPSLLEGDATTQPRKGFPNESEAYDDEEGRSIASSADSYDSASSHLDNKQSSHIIIVLAQCALAPPFCVWSITSSMKAPGVAWKTGVAFLSGLCAASLIFLAVRRAKMHGGAWYNVRTIAAVGWARVAMGFVVSILYIMTIVDEVVSILQTLGIILGLSDAILGLTVFAMGNSLGDLVANVTIARMGHPVMAISACFAGPLLNLLLGIGLSGSYLLSWKEHQQDSDHFHRSERLMVLSAESESGVYHIDFSPTLLVSGIGLLVILIGTLIAVPLNGFYLNRTIGATLIITYVVIMTLNIGVEIWTLGHALVT